MMAASADLRSPRIPYQPALDGLRGIGMLATMCYHAQFSWAAGSFLAISMFFTLSGYLITSLFLLEKQRTGRIRLGAFWARRFRRLMPAALMTLAGMSLFGIFVASPDQLARLHDDVVWSLFYVANWHFLLSDASYFRLFEAPSPVQHFWSLAIEEQFYGVFPLVVFGCFRFSASRTALGWALASLIAASIAVSIGLSTATFSGDRIYYGSDARAAEVLVGALLATCLSGRSTPAPAIRRTVEWLGVPALFLMLGLWMSVPLSSQWLYLGGFAAYSVLSAFVITAGVQPAGWVRRFLSVKPLCWIGRVSYGAYLVHWPIFLWLSEGRTGLDRASLFAVRAFATFVVAGLSYRYIESPIRSGRMLTGWRPFVVAPAAFAGVLLATTAVTSGVGSAALDPVTARDEARVKAFVERMRDLKIPEGEPAPSLLHAPPRVAIFGDSTAVTLGVGLGEWLERRGGMNVRMGVAELGCGIARSGVYRFKGVEYERPSHCTDRERSWPEALRTSQPDVVIVSAGPWDVCDRKLPGDDTWRKPGDPVLDAYLREEMLSAADLLLETTPLVLWLSQPAVDERDASGATPDPPFPETEPARMRYYNHLVFELAARRPRRVHVIDLASYMRTLPGGELDSSYRPDGTHFSVAGASRISRQWLGEEILRAYREEAARAVRQGQARTRWLYLPGAIDDVLAALTRVVPEWEDLVKASFLPPDLQEKYLSVLRDRVERLTDFGTLCRALMHITEQA